MGFLDGLANSVGKSVSKGIEDFDLGKLFNNAVGNNAQPVNPVVQFTPPASIISPQSIKKRLYCMVCSRRIWAIASSVSFCVTQKIKPCQYQL
jgi:hypothetical protein